MPERILVIDDESSIRSSLQGILEDEGYEVQTADSGETGLELLASREFGLVLLDIWLPEMSGIDVLKEVRTFNNRPPIVVISGHGTVETAVHATKLGAFDFLEKPLSLDKVVITVKNALRQHRLEEENLQLRERLRARLHLVGKSAPIRKLREEIRKVAPTNGRILISGENGTGKELVARLIHLQSRRKDKRLVEINCAAIPDDLIETELFGLTRGHSPLGAKEKKGKLLLADGGTLFLDEVGEMNPKVQARLVKALVGGTTESVGSGEGLPFDARLIAATSRNPKDLIAQGKLREDLFFKLNVIPMHIPPLRERTEDIPLLIVYFLRAYALEYGKKPKTISPAATSAFQNYPWPGNVSELMNVIERFVIMVEDEEIGVDHLNLLVEIREQGEIPGLVAARSLGEAALAFERGYLQRALARNGWNMAQTSAELGIPQDVLKDKVLAHRIRFLN
jgi:two-component system nitrogen regulation response regulator NtrX